MNFKNIIVPIVLALTLASSITLAKSVSNSITESTRQEVQVQQIRNATIKISYGNTIFLVDPMLSKKDTYPGFEGTYRSFMRMPMIELPMSVEDVIKDVDAVIVTHTHLDHWDDEAQSALPKAILLFTQNEADAKLIRSQGFTNVKVLNDNTVFKNVELVKIGGQHGTDEMYAVPELAKLLGEAMGVVFKSPNSKTVYVAGDTIWNNYVSGAINTFNPDAIILNTGYARLDGFKNSIIMGKEDAERAYHATCNAKIIAVHMDTVNHTELTRSELHQFVQKKGIQNRVFIPADGEVIKL
ncbi:MBL fold metallo-hydrolase [Neisseria sp. Ec49-e6-T10]|uniref:MBL fold metallo-hydrolase n=1 Tax=Neisseria sp. Ec49-e6-T10 TaxID=3140744 RepID=UPI003EC0F5CB